MKALAFSVQLASNNVLSALISSGYERQMALAAADESLGEFEA